MNWLRRLFAKPEVPAVPIAEVFAAYQQGLAQGEVIGRTALARELEIAFGIDSGHPMTPEDAVRIRAKQVH